MNFGSKNKYNETKDIFISYRRKGGEDFAKYLEETLIDMGYSVFLDVEDIRPGADFNERLYEVIDNCKDFILILPEHGLDRCVENENDWVRLEIERAREKGKNIIPVRLRDFTMPENLPPSLEFLNTQHAMTPTPDLYREFVEKMTKSFESKPKKKRNPLLFLLPMILLAVIGLLLYSKFSKYPHNEKQEALVSQLVSYMVLNIQNYDLANQSFIEGINDTRNYLDGTGKLDQETLLASLELRRGNISSIKVKDFSNPDALVGSPFKIDDIDAFPVFLQGCYSGLDGLLIEIENWVEMGIDKEYFSKLLNLHEEFAGLELEALFYGMNGTLLPVTNEDALKDLKTVYLPKISSMRSMTLSKDADQIEGKMEAAISRQEKIVNEDIPRLYDDIASDLDKLEFENQLITIQLLKEHYADDPEMTDNLQKLEERVLRNIATKEEIEAKQNEVDALSDRLTQAKNELEVTHGPLESDDQELLWAKGSLFLAYDMNDVAKRCFTMYIDHSIVHDETICGEAALKYTENRDDLGISGGVVVFGYEDLKDRQNVEIGDIIYELDGQPVNTISEFSEARVSGTEQEISILRFYDSGYEQLTETIYPEKGGLYLMSLIYEGN